MEKATSTGLVSRLFGLIVLLGFGSLVNGNTAISNLACHSEVIVTLNDNCIFTLTADLVLTGDLGNLKNEDFDLIVVDSDIDNGPIIDGCGTFNYEIRLKDGIEGINFSGCWGIVHTEDKTPPTISCPAEIDQIEIQQQIQRLNGAIEIEDDTLNLAHFSCFYGEQIPEQGQHYYDLFSFQVSTSGIYTFNLDADFIASAALYQSVFKSQEPCANIISQSTHSEPFIRLTLPLRVDETYILLTSSLAAQTTGSYEWNIFSENEGKIIGLPFLQETLSFDLLCTDVDPLFLNLPQSYLVNSIGQVIPGSLSDTLEYILNLTGFPEISDNCSTIKVTVSDELFENGDCGEKIIIRSFQLEDQQNSICVSSINRAQCQQSILFRNPGIEELTFPPLTTVIECDESFPVDSTGNPHPDISGYPFLHTLFGTYSINPNLCNIGASYDDEEPVEVCENAYKFLRNWYLIDWCNPGSSSQVQQLIKVGDFSGPTISIPDDQSLVYSTEPFDCTAAFEVPLPEVEDNCSSWEVQTEIVADIQVDITNQYGQIIGQRWDTLIIVTISEQATSRLVSSIPLGAYRFVYTVTDSCSNKSVLKVPFQVKDKIAPVAICNEELHISLGGDGNARVFKEDIDEGSRDNCPGAEIKVRRWIDGDIEDSCLSLFDYNENGIVVNDEISPDTLSNNQIVWVTPWLDFIDITCCDVSTTINIELRIVDQAGNQNQCWLSVVPEDKVAPFCIAPHNRVLNCSELPYQFDPNNIEQLQQLFNDPDLPKGLDNCNIAEILELDPVVNWEDCNYGTIIRQFKVIDDHGNTSSNTCQQTIEISPLRHYEILFPKDAAAVCGIPDVDTLRYNEIGCDLLAISKDTTVFEATNDECFKLFITHRIINWCEYDGESAPVVIGRREDCDENEPGYLDEPEGIWLLVLPDGNTYLDRDQEINNQNPSRFETCNFPQTEGHWTNSILEPRLRSNGFWEYTQHVRVYDDQPPLITFKNPEVYCITDIENCGAEIQATFRIEDICGEMLMDGDSVNFEVKVFNDIHTDGILDTEVTQEVNFINNHPNYTVTGFYPLGDHTLEVQVTDGCGNYTEATIPFKIKDCSPPAPICINLTTVVVMPLTPPTDVDGDGDIDLAANRVWATDLIASEVNDCSEPIQYSINFLNTPPNIDSTSLLVTCQLNELETLAVEVHAWDSAGNSDFCRVFIAVDDNNNLCDTSGMFTIAGTISTEASIAVEGVEVNISGNANASMHTETDGYYRFGQLLNGYDYSIAPGHDQDYKNGVTTFDLLLISKHILGIRRLDSPYKMIAADINRSKSITTLDVIRLRKLILGINDHFENNTSWRFIASNYEFPDPQQPWLESFPEIQHVNNLPGTIFDLDFTAIKVGDVNGSAIANSRQTAERTPDEVVNLISEDIVLKQGEMYEINFQLEAKQNIVGLQSTLQYDFNALSLIDLHVRKEEAENFGWAQPEDGWITFSNFGETLTSNKLFSIQFYSKKAGQLRDFMALSSRITPCEAYHTSGAILQPTLKFQDGKNQAIKLYQNYPNPFKTNSLIEFYLPKKLKVRLSFFDLQGRLVHLIKGTYDEGLHQVLLDKKIFPKGGIYYYTLETRYFTDTKRLILVD